MEEPDGDAELVVITLPGVQRFIAEARSTADLHAGSALISELSAAMAQAVLNFQPPARLVLPSLPLGEIGMPNRLVALTAAGTGRDLARRVADAAGAAWRDKVRDLGISPGAPGALETPGFPQVQWVVAGATAGGYREQWEQASACLARRKRIHSFTFLPTEQERICSLTGRWVALPVPPESAWNVRKDEALSVTAHVKRKFSRDARNGFPSTWSVATAPYRAAVIEKAEQDTSLRTAVADLRGYVTELLDGCTRQDKAKIERSSGSPPGMPESGDADLAWFRSVEGLWCVPSAWDPDGLRVNYELAETPDPDTCHLVRLTAGELVRMAARAGLPPLTSYLAVIAQDADHMGERLAEFPDGTDPVAWHQKVSAALGQAARSQQEKVERPGAYGRVVYAGGDDLLALTPASTALPCLRDANAAFRCAMSGCLPDSGCLPGATASAAVVFFHASWPLQSAVAAVQSLLEEAKKAGRPGLGLSVLRRGGERTSLVLPWFDPADPEVPMADHVTALATSIGGADPGPSGRLASELERDRAALATLSPEWLARELLRRNARHGGPAAGKALLSLSYEDAAGRRKLPVDAVTVARFLAAETIARGAPAEGGA